MSIPEVHASTSQQYHEMRRPTTTETVDSGFPREKILSPAHSSEQSSTSLHERLSDNSTRHHSSDSPIPHATPFTAHKDRSRTLPASLGSRAHSAMAEPSPIAYASAPSRATSSMATASGLTTANSDATPVLVNGRARVRDIMNDEYRASRPRVDIDVLSIDNDETIRETPYTEDPRKSSKVRLNVPSFNYGPVKIEPRREHDELPPLHHSTPFAAFPEPFRNKRMESKLATQLRLLIIQLDVAQAKHRKVLEEFTREKENLEAEKKQFQDECSTKSREIAQLRADMRGKKDRHDVHSELERRVKELEKELEERRTKDAESASRISHLRTDLNAERNSRKLLEEQLKELKEKHVKAQDELRIARQRGTTLTLKLRECEDAKKTTNDCTQKLAGRNETLLEQLEKARRQCNEKSSEISRLRLELRKCQESRDASLECRPQIRTALRHADTRSAPSTASSSVHRQLRPADNEEESSADELSRMLMSTTPKDKQAKTVSWGPPVYYSPRNSDQSTTSEADTSAVNLTENLDMEPVKWERTQLGTEYTFSDGKDHATRFVQLVDHCSLYKYNEGDLLWVGRPSQRFTVYYSSIAKAYCVVTAAGTRIRWFRNAQLEIYYTNGDLSAVFPSGRRVEHITPPRSDTFFEIWEPDSKTATKHTMTGDSAITPVNTDRMSERANKSFVSKITSDGHPSLQFENAEFKIRRTEDGIAKLHLMEEQSQVTLKSGDEMQVLINHVKQLPSGEKEKQMCCRHTPDGAIVAEGISVLPGASSADAAPRGLNRKYLKAEQAAPRPLDEGYFLSGPLQRHASDEHDISAEYGVDPNSAQ